MRRLSAALIALTCGGVLTIAGCGDKSVKTTPAPSASTLTTTATATASATVTVTSSPTPSATPTESSAAQPTAKIGSTISLAGNRSGESADVTVTKIVDPASTANTYSTPGAGKRFVAIQFLIKNTGTAPYSGVPSNGAKVIDSNDQSFDSTYQETTAGPDFSGITTLPPGQSGRGFITFEVPKASQLTLVQFTLNSGFADQTGQWSLK